MVKKLFWLLVIAVILQVTLIACCSDITNHTRLTDFRTSMVNQFSIEYPDSFVLELDSVFIEVATSAERIAWNLLFIENSYATSSCDYYEQLKNEIVSIEVTSDKILFGLPAGTNVSEFVGKYRSTSGNSENINNWIVDMNFHFSGEQKYWFVFFENPNSEEYFKLNIKLNFQDGSHMVAETQYVRVK